jgi:magnesium transporter
MRIFHITSDSFTELPEWPTHMPSTGYVWVGLPREQFGNKIATLQTNLQQLTGGQLVDLHVSDLLNAQLPSHFDYTSWYELLVFRRLAAGSGSSSLFLDDPHGSANKASAAKRALDAIDTSPVGFAVFKRVLLTVHPADCSVRDFFIVKLQQMLQATEVPSEARSASLLRLPTSPADLMLRMVNHMVDGYLELRRLLTKQLGHLQQELLSPSSRFDSWQLLLESRNTLQLLEDTCEDQRSAVVELLDALEELPSVPEAQVARDRELLRLRSRDVIEHIERVLGHVRRLESSAETAVQMHFSAQSNRTNDIMRTLTVITAIFMPLNLITGFFGMNFDGLPLIHSHAGVWLASSFMLIIGAGLSWLFWRKRYLSTSPKHD